MNLSRNAGRRKSWFTSKWFLIIVLITFVLIFIALIKEFYRSHQINKEIVQLQEEIQNLEGKNTEFSEFVEFLKTDVYLEEQARIKLGMKAPGEKVIVLKENGIPIDKNDSVENSSFTESSGTKREKQKNTSKWWGYFWNINS